MRDAELAWASAVFDPVLLPTSSLRPPAMPSLGPLIGLEWWLLDRMLRRQDKPLRAVPGSRRQPVGSHGHDVPGRGHPACTVACSPSIAPPPPDLAPTAHFTGVDRPDSPAALPAGLNQPDGGPPPLVVTIGSMAAPDPAALASR